MQLFSLFEFRMISIKQWNKKRSCQKVIPDRRTFSTQQKSINNYSLDLKNLYCLILHSYNSYMIKQRGISYYIFAYKIYGHQSTLHYM